VFTKTTFLIGLSLNQLKDADHAACPELNTFEQHTGRKCFFNLLLQL